MRLSRGKALLLIIPIFGLFVMGGCGGGRHYVKPSERGRKKLIVLPAKPEPSQRPYVVDGKRYYPLPDAEGFIQYGKASWYGQKFHGRTTASGEIYDMNKLTGAHKTLPLGTYVRIQNLSNKRWVVLRVNDRGPFVKGRIVDLSYAAAKEIGLIGPGVAEVKLVALGREVGRLKSPQGLKPVVEIEDLYRGEFTIQVGAFKSRYNALKLADRLKVVDYVDYVEVSVYEDREKGTLYRVRVTKSKDLTGARKMEKKLEYLGFEQAFIVSL